MLASNGMDAKKGRRSSSAGFDVDICRGGVRGEEDVLALTAALAEEEEAVGVKRDTRRMAQVEWWKRRKELWRQRR